MTHVVCPRDVPGRARFGQTGPARGNLARPETDRARNVGLGRSRASVPSGSVGLGLVWPRARSVSGLHVFGPGLGPARTEFGPKNMQEYNVA